jgi:hypothetical protein
MSILRNALQSLYAAAVTFGRDDYPTLLEEVRRTYNLCGHRSLPLPCLLALASAWRGARQDTEPVMALPSRPPRG